jgi:glycosyltransferase involved in cell wall biosynthesis
LRIAFFTETFLPRIDGTVTRLSQTIRQLRGLGHEVLVIAPDGGIEEFEGARIHGVPGFPFPLYPEQKVAIPRPSIGRTLAAFRPHLIHALHPVLIGASAFHYSSVLRVPLVVSHHAQLHKWLSYYGLGVLEPAMWRAVRSAYNRADLVLVTSNVMRELLCERGILRVELWQRGIDTEAFHPQHASHEMRAKLTQGHPQDKLLLYVGRLSAEKEIEQCRGILQAIPGLRLALVGDGPHRSKLEQHFAGTPTNFVGFVKGPDLAAAFASADVFFLPSRTETLGLVLLEAMAAGLPVVAAAEGGILDVVQDGVTGHLYDPTDLSGAVVAIRRLLNDSAHRETIRRNAHLDVEKWGWPAATRQLVGFYRDVLAREEELSCKIAQEKAPGASPEAICQNLRISRATFNRLMRAPAVAHARR